MLYQEFLNLTNLTTTHEDYTNQIEPKYMNSKLDKQSWCKQYIRQSKQDKTQIYKSDLKQCLKYSIENWLTNEMSEDETFLIKYADNTIIRFNYEYEGKKPNLNNIVNIHFSSGEECIDYYNDFIGEIDSYDFLNQTFSEVYKNPLIVKDMNDYYLEFEKPLN